MTILIAGAGIAGLSLGLTLHQIGVPFRIYEATPAIKPLGVGINLQPNAVRELIELGLEPELDKIGVRTRQYGFYTKYGHTIWEEPRGQFAGYSWPQFSVHRGNMQVMLFEELCRRAGPDCVVTGARAIGFETTDDSATLLLEDGGRVQGELIIAADGIHSAIRKQMNPDEGDPIWNGAVMWRGTTLAKPFFGGAAMALAGHDSQRMVAYPISDPDPDTGLAIVNWIAELRVDPAQGWNKEDWNRAADINDFLPDFKDWVFDWLDCPALIEGADAVFEYPMVDRDPLDQWTMGRVTLIGDAAHPTFPVGSSGASQAIVDARLMGAQLLEHGVSEQALHAYEAKNRPGNNAVIRANRGSGPDVVMQWLEDRCGGQFDKVEDVIPLHELAAHAAKYKVLAGTSIEVLNAQPQIIPDDAQLPKT